MAFGNDIGTAILRGLFNGIPLDEEPTIRKVLVDEEHRWRDRIDKVCEGNQDLTEIRDAISDVRMRRKREFRLQQQIAKLASKATKSRPSGPLQARIEEIEDEDKEAPSIPDPPVPETGRTLPLLLPSPLLPPVVESARQDIVREVRSSEASHTGNPVGVVSSTKPATRVETPTLSPQVVLPSVRCIICNYTPGPVTHCSQRCGEIAKITWILCGPSSTPQSKPQFTRAQVKVVQAALGSKSNENALMEFCRVPSDGQVALDLIQWILDNRSKWPSDQTTAAVHADIALRLRQVLMKFSLASGSLPSSLFLSGVSCQDKEPLYGGSFADISLGEYRSKVVALKRLRVFQIASPKDTLQLRKRLLHELLVWKNLRHQHILPVIGIDETIFSGNPAMVLPWMENGSIRRFLGNIVDTGSFDTDELVLRVLNWIQQMALGLQYLHGEDVIHGDFRGDNVLVDNNENICLTDFGLSVFAQEASETYGSTRGGNVRWLSPELIDPDQFPPEFHSGRPTCASDVYSFACVCVELYTNRPPFGNQFPEPQLTLKVLSGIRPSRPTFLEGESMGDTLWSILNRCWAQMPSARPSAAELAMEISASLWSSQ